MILYPKGLLQKTSVASVKRCLKNCRSILGSRKHFFFVSIVGFAWIKIRTLQAITQDKLNWIIFVYMSDVNFNACENMVFLGHVFSPVSKEFWLAVESGQKDKAWFSLQLSLTEIRKCYKQKIFQHHKSFKNDLPPPWFSFSRNWSCFPAVRYLVPFFFQIELEFFCVKIYCVPVKILPSSSARHHYISVPQPTYQWPGPCPRATGSSYN